VVSSTLVARHLRLFLTISAALNRQGKLLRQKDVDGMQSAPLAKRYSVEVMLRAFPRAPRCYR
jgi:hypothetical protein